ncbi:MAG: hypothetical protein ACRD8Z_03855 [Nitrososphaeraceae archaeon]
MTLTEKQIVQFRRDSVKDLRRKGYTQRDIAAELRVSLTSVHKDIKWLLAQADERIKDYTDKYLPDEHERCLDTLDSIIKEMWNLKFEDNRELIQARSLIKDCAMLRLELTGSGKVIERAARYIQKQKARAKEQEVQIDNDADNNNNSSDNNQYDSSRSTEVSGN